MMTARHPTRVPKVRKIIRNRRPNRIGSSHAESDQIRSDAAGQLENRRALKVQVGVGL